MASTDDSPEVRRSSIEKQPIVMPDDDAAPSAFERLPDEIILQILQATDPNGFASLALISSKWRSVAQQADLYAHHLSNCPSYAMSHGARPATATDDNLPELRKLFAREVKRNLFAAYLRPNQTVIKIISNSISSSSCPGGEGIQFSPSPRGHHVLAYNSSRIYVIDVRGPEINVQRELKILRRPAATCIRDDGSLLAVLLTEMQVDLYDLTETPPKHTRSIILDHSPRAISLSPCGSVLAAAYEGGIEVSSINPGALATDRRAVKCDAVDALAFSIDGTQILGTTVQSSQPNTVVLTAPYYDPGSHMADDNMSALWTTSILFPNTSRDCSHAVLIQNGKHEEAGWTFTYDRSFETFRAVRIDDLRNGTTYFTGPIPEPTSQAKLVPCTLPAASYCGDLVSAGFQGREIWLYGVPEDLDAVPDCSNASSDSVSTNSLNRRNSGPSARSASRMQENSNEAPRVPQWQILCDKWRNTFVGGFKIGELDGVNMVKWVADYGDSVLKERLVVAARGVDPGRPITEDEGIDFVDGGRITLVDFDYGLEDGQVTEITIEVGTKEPEILEEEHRDMDTEVAIVRRRTVAQKRGNRSAVMRAATTAARVTPLPTQVSSRLEANDEDDPLVPRRIGVVPQRAAPPAVPDERDEEGESESIMEEQEALDAPYSHTSPRSGTTLRRAATAAAVNRRLHPTPAAAGPVQYRRADGRSEHPHESDADNWVPPPPPYQKEDPVDLPSFLRHTAVTVTGVPNAQGQQQQPSVSQPDTQPLLMPTSAQQQQQPARRQTVGPVRRTVPAASGTAEQVPPVPPMPTVPPVPQLPPQQAPQPVEHRRVTSVSTVGTQSEDVQQSTAGGSNYLDGENIYDVSPAASPSLAQARPHHQQHIETRDFSGMTAGSEASVVSPASPPGPSQQPAAVVSPTQASVVSRESVGPPVLDLQIPSPSLNHTPTWNSPSANSPEVRRLTNANTWPAQPRPPAAPAVLPAGYPYSAPPTNMNANRAMAQAYPPAPRPDQLASLSNRRLDQAPRRLSGAAFPLQRVPVGSRASGDYSGRMQHPRPMSQQQQYQQIPPQQYQHPRPASQQQQYQQAPPQQHQYPRPASQQQQYVQHYPQPQSPQHMQPYMQQSPQVAPMRPYQQQASQPQQISRMPPPPEETPMIISTPKGVSGALDAPDNQASGGNAEPTILAPVPRHPRPSTQAAVLRPTMDRLETIYSVASSHGVPASEGGAMGGAPMMAPPPGGYANPNNQNNVYLAAPAGSSSTRVSSLNRKQSRAERSAAKNIADAKRRGWTGRRRSKRAKKQLQKERDMDAASSAAWTDVTTFSGRESAFGGSLFHGPMGPEQVQAREQALRQAHGQGRGKNGHKCAVM